MDFWVEGKKYKVRSDVSNIEYDSSGRLRVQFGVGATACSYIYTLPELLDKGVLKEADPDKEVVVEYTAINFRCDDELVTAVLSTRGDGWYLEGEHPLHRWRVPAEPRDLVFRVGSEVVRWMARRKAANEQIDRELGEIRALFQHDDEEDED